ncbi:MAG TPA: tetratricopeptide repeat protein [Candidatus Acidoferrales bacterium]|nr:tetratricopeptide repeat protein [Candidatus Acidoferrales bacterium]
MIFIPLLILGGIELGLRLTGYGYPTDFFSRIRIDGQDYYVPNERFGDRFFPPAIARTATLFRFPATKGTNVYRIFVLGESAAMGDPDASYGVARYLQVLLRERYPGIHFEVICVAVTAIDSNVILPIARDCARHQGDLWVIYMGNNEMVGPFGAETAYGIHAPPLGIIRTMLAIKTTRIGQLMDSLIQHLRSSSSRPKTWGGMQMFMNGRVGYNDPARLRAYANFRGNLAAILQVAHRAGVPVVLSTVAVNLEDCAPFASIHAAGLSTNQLSAWNEIFAEGVTNETAGACRKALALYRQAAEIDPQFAELQFRRGYCELALTNPAQALQYFTLARDYDALDFRADTRINSAIQDAGRRHANEGVYLVDAEQVIAQNTPDGIPGLNFFYEHVHLKFGGNYLLALNFADKIKGLLPGSITAHDDGIWAPEEVCERRLAVTVWDRLRVWQPIFDRISSPPFTGQYLHSAFYHECEVERNEAKARMDSQTPEQARQIYEQALALAPDDYLLHVNFERFLEAGGYLTQAIAESKRCCEIFPRLPGGFYYTGTLLAREGNIGEATNYFLRAVAIQSDYAQAQTALGEIFANQQKTADAVLWFERAIRSNPNYVETYLALGFLEQNQGNTAAAAANYQKAAKLEPEGPADYFNRANTAAALFQWDEAIADLQAVVRTKPDFWQAHYLLGIQLAANGREAEAQRELEEAIHYRPDFAAAHLYLGITLAAQKMPAQALAEFRTVLQLDPANASARQEIESLQPLEQNK